MAEAKRSRFAGAEALAQDVSPFVGRAVEQGERLRGSVAALFPEGGVRQGPDTGLELFPSRGLPDVGSFPMPSGGTLREAMEDPATQEAIEFVLGGGMMTPLMGMVRAFHGTGAAREAFEQTMEARKSRRGFDISKVGEGQGAQSFGHGLYFAENPKVANQYRKELASSSQVDELIGRAGIRDQELSSYVSTRLSAEGDPSVTARGLERFADTMDDVPEDAAKLRMVASDMRDNPEAWRSAMEGGSFMEVTIDADPEDFLDWDKPLSQQSPKVRESVDKAFGDVRPVRLPDGKYSMTRVEPSGEGRIFYGISEDTPEAARTAWLKEHDSMTGADYYREVAGFSNDQEAASEALREAGIPGIRYLDQGSRGLAEDAPLVEKYILESGGLDAAKKRAFAAAKKAEREYGVGSANASGAADWLKRISFQEEGTRNIVLFDDSLVEIQSINDVPLPKAR